MPLLIPVYRPVLWSRRRHRVDAKGQHAEIEDGADLGACRKRPQRRGHDRRLEQDNQELIAAGVAHLDVTWTIGLRHERRMLSLANERKHAPRARQRPGSGNRLLSP
jgi:hypothetical protein